MLRSGILEDVGAHRAPDAVGADNSVKGFGSAVAKHHIDLSPSIFQRRELLVDVKHVLRQRRHQSGEERRSVDNATLVSRR